MPTSPFDDIRALLATLPARDAAASEAVSRRLDAGGEGLGRLGAISAWAAGWQGRARPGAERALVCLFAATHGVASRGREAAAASEVRALMDRFSDGSAPVGAVCAAGGLGFRAFDLALDVPTGDITETAAMSERDCVATMAFGMEATAGGADVVAVGVVGRGAEIAAAATLAALYGDPPGRWVGEGGQADVVTIALLRDARASSDPLAVLASLGGRDLAALAGAILAARHGGVPVVLDGFVAAAAAAVLQRMEPGALDHCLAGHVSSHPGHAALLARLGLEPLLPGLDLPEGSGVGAALALGLVKTAIGAERVLGGTPSTA